MELKDSEYSGPSEDVITFYYYNNYFTKNNPGRPSKSSSNFSNSHLWSFSQKTYTRKAVSN